MDRRCFLAAAAAGLAGPNLAALNPQAFVTSDVGPLRHVLIHHPGPELLNGPLESEDPEEGLTYGLMGEALAAQHRAFVELLSASHVEALPFERLLDEAIRRCAAAGRFSKWVQAEFPHLLGREDEITAAALIGAVGDFLDEEGAIRPLRCLFFTRDIAAMTPLGLVLANFVNRDRAPEARLLRFTFRWSPTLRPFPIAFDAGQERVFMQGGDLIVIDDRTLLLGVGNLTEEAAAGRLARRLGMDVVSVRLPGGGRGGRPVIAPWDGLRTLFLHLDSVFNMVNGRLAVTVPYVFESEYQDQGSLRALAAGLKDLPGGPYRPGPRLREIGRIRRFRAKTGAPDAGVVGMKLVDFLRERDYRFVYVGGPPPRRVDADYLRTRVIPELLSQAANVVATAPGRVLAYEGNDQTIRCLKEAGVAVATFPSSWLVGWHGGPHCMTMPLERLPAG
jgi:arginine deiminase